MKLARTLASAAILGLSLGSAHAAEVKKIGLAVANLQANFFNQIKQSVEAEAKKQRHQGRHRRRQGRRRRPRSTRSRTFSPRTSTRSSTSRPAPPPRPFRSSSPRPPAFRSSTSTATPTAHRATPSSPPTPSRRPRPSASTSSSKAGGKGKMVIIHGQKGTTPEVDRTKGCTEALKANPDVKVVAEQYSNIWSQDEGFQIMQNMLQANPDVTIVFCARPTRLALGAAQAIKVANPSQKIWSAASTVTRRRSKRSRTASSTSPRRSRPRRWAAMAVESAVEARRRREGAAGPAAGCDADHQGQRRRLHRQPSVIELRREEARAMTEPVSSLRGSRKRYGPLQVLRDVDLDVHPGEVVALLGENGAGKSTLSGIIAGSRTPSEGTMTWLGQPYAPASRGEAIDKGVVLIHQELQLLPRAVDRRERLRRPLADEERRASTARQMERAPEQLPRLNLHIPATRKVPGSRTRQPAAGRDRQGAGAGREAADPRRADGRARRRGDRGPVRAGVASCAPRASASSTSPTAWRRSAGSPTASSCCATASGCGIRRQRRCRGAAGRSAWSAAALERMFPHDPGADGRRGVLRCRGPDRAGRLLPRRLASRCGGRDPRHRRPRRRRPDRARARHRRRRPDRGRTIRPTATRLQTARRRRRHRRGHRAGAGGSQGPGPRGRASDRREHRSTPISTRSAHGGWIKPAPSSAFAEAAIDRLRREGTADQHAADPVGRQPAEGGDRQVAGARPARWSSSTSRRAASTSAPAPAIYDIIVELARAGRRRDRRQLRPRGSARAVAPRHGPRPRRAARHPGRAEDATDPGSWSWPSHERRARAR